MLPCVLLCMRACFCAVPQVRLAQWKRQRQRERGAASKAAKVAEKKREELRGKIEDLRERLKDKERELEEKREKQRDAGQCLMQLMAEDGRFKENGGRACLGEDGVEDMEGGKTGEIRVARAMSAARAKIQRVEDIAR